MRKITVAATDEMTAMHPAGMPCRLTVNLKDGSELSHELQFQKGHPANPMNEAELATKFRNLFAEYGDADQADEIISLIRRLEDIDDITALISAMEKRG